MAASAWAFLLLGLPPLRPLAFAAFKPSFIRSLVIWRSSWEKPAMAEFVPETADGTFDIVFEVARADVEGKVTVCFETLVRDSRDVIVLADIADADQTVEVYALPHTGDATDLASASWAAAAGMAMAAIGAYLARVRKEQSL